MMGSCWRRPESGNGLVRYVASVPLRLETHSVGHDAETHNEDLVRKVQRARQAPGDAHDADKRWLSSRPRPRVSPDSVCRRLSARRSAASLKFCSTSWLCNQDLRCAWQVLTTSVKEYRVPLLLKDSVLTSSWAQLLQVMVGVRTACGVSRASCLHGWFRTSYLYF